MYSPKRVAGPEKNCSIIAWALHQNFCPKHICWQFNFSIRMKTQKEVTTILKTWHIAYHGTKEQDIQPTLEGGILLIPGMMVFF